MLLSVILSTATLVLAAQTPAPEAQKPAVTETTEAAAPKPQASEATETAEPAEAAEAAAPEPQAAKPAKPPVDTVLARIGADTIRQSDFELFLNTTLTDQQRMQLQFVEGAREQYLTRYLEFKALAAKARKEGFAKKPEHAKKLAIMDMQLLIQALMDRDGPALQAKLAITDADVKAFVDASTDPKKADVGDTTYDASLPHRVVVQIAGAARGTDRMVTRAVSASAPGRQTPLRRWKFGKLTTQCQ